MIAMGYTYAGILIIVLFFLVTCCIFAKPSGTYDDEIENESYDKVANLSTDA